MPAFQAIDWYDTPLYYDIVFEEDTQLEVEFLEEMQRRYGLTRGKHMLEPACGSGRLVVAMAERGWKVTGFDLSQAMLDFTQERLTLGGLKAKLAVKRMESFSYKQKFDMAHCFVSTFKYLLKESDARNHLKCVADSLKPGGLYVLGLHLSDYEDEGCNRERWVGERDGVKVVCNIQGWPADRKARTEKVRSRLVVHEAGVEKRTETHWTFRTYDAAQLRRLLRSVPEFELVSVKDFSYETDFEREIDDEQHDCVLILRRRA